MSQVPGRKQTCRVMKFFKDYLWGGFNRLLKNFGGTKPQKIFLNSIMNSKMIMPIKL